jgi:DNA-binding transcriptional LysR family regulator
MDDSSLIARHICDLERTICASPAYLKRHGTPKEPEDLLDHNCIMITGVPTMQVWNFDTPRGPVSIEPRGRITVNTVESMLELALHGAGITRFADMIAAEPIRQKRLIPLLVDSHRVEPVPLYAVYPQSRYRTPKLTAMLDFLMEKFAHAPWRSEMAPRHARTR